MRMTSSDTNIAIYSTNVVLHVVIKRQINTTHIDTDNNFFLLMQESYPSSRDDYDIMNHSERMSISILLNGMVSDFDRNEKITYNKAIKNQ